MANCNDGKKCVKKGVRGFKNDIKWLESEINSYKQMTYSGEIELPSWSDFCSRAGITEQTAAEVMARADDGVNTAYYDCAMALWLLWQWMRGQYMSSPGWSATAARVQKALALYRMLPSGEERAKPSANAKNTGPQTVTINFGAGDKRARDAGG